MNKKTAKWTLTGAVAAAAFLVSGIANAETYTVEAGDTLSAIANEKNTTLEKLVELNKIADPNHIRVGQILELGNSAKTSETSVAATATPVNNYAAPAATANSAATSGGLVLSNGNTAGATGSSGASGLFQTMPGWGSTATVDDQIQSAYSAYSAQGLSAWGY